MAFPQVDEYTEIFGEDEFQQLKSLVEQKFPNIKYVDNEQKIGIIQEHWKEHISESRPFQIANICVNFFLDRGFHFIPDSYKMYVTKHKRYTCNDGDCISLLLHIVFHLPFGR